MMGLSKARASVLGILGFASVTFSAPVLIAHSSLTGTSDLSGLSETLENGLSQNVLGGLGSGLAWAGGSTFLATPDRGPNANPYTGGAAVDNTVSYIARFQTLDLNLVEGASGGLPYTLTPTLTNTTLLYSDSPLNYGAAAGVLPNGAPVENSVGVNYFTGRSDGFGPGNSSNPNSARFDPEAIRVSNDGKSVFVSDEYGPYVYQFDRATGQRIKVFTLPDNVAIANLSSNGATEIANNTSGRVANKGMEGLAITPDGKTLVGFMQSPLKQDRGDGGRANRMITIDIASGETHEYAYDNKIGTKNYNSSEILALNDHQFLVLERDGKGLGDGTPAVVKQIYAFDLTGAQDVTLLSGESALLAKAPTKKLFLDIEGALKSFGIPDAQIPAKLEGMSFGQDIMMASVVYHTIYIANDNDFVSSLAAGANPNAFYVFAFSDADLAVNGLSFVNQNIASVPEPKTILLMDLGIGLLIFANRRKKII